MMMCAMKIERELGDCSVRIFGVVGGGHIEGCKLRNEVRGMRMYYPDGSEIGVVIVCEDVW